MQDPMDDLAHPKHATQRLFTRVRKGALRLNFYRAHMLYFVVVIAISSVVVYGEGIADRPDDASPLAYIDALFLCCSAMTTTGLNTVNMSVLTTFQQAVLCVLLVVGNLVFVSTFIVVIRRYFFQRKLKDVVNRSVAARRAIQDLEQRGAREGGTVGGNSVRQRGTASKSEGSKNKKGSEMQKKRTNSANGPYHQQGFGFFPAPWETEYVRKLLGRLFDRLPTSLWPDEQRYVSFKPNLDEKGRFLNLTESQRLELGGVEYRALQALLYILVGYQVFWFSLGMLFLVPYAYRQSVRNILFNSKKGDINPGWWASFLVASEFGNCGLNLLNANLIPLRAYYFILIVAGGISTAGQTQFPILLRLIIWTLKKMVPRDSRLSHTLAFLLHHPRRCFIYLFPSKETWDLLAIQLAIDFTAWILFLILNIGMPEVMAIPVGERINAGLFQATGLRTSGAYIINFSYLAPALQVVYLVIMYISSFPIVMALRKTNTYEESSIGVERSESKGKLSYHLKTQLAYDMWFQTLAWILICIVERGKLTSSQPGFSIFSILFEVTSAYGTVGLSTGVPYDQYSLSGAFSSLSKVIMLFVMVRGRHRGLPFAIDRSILLPGEELMHRLDEEYNERGEYDEREEEVLEEYIEESGRRETGPGKGAMEQDPEEQRPAVFVDR